MEKKNNFCSGCGEELESGQSFCPNCGKKINDSEKNENENMDESKEEEVINNTKNEKLEELENNANKKNTKVGDVIRYIATGFFGLAGISELSSGEVLDGIFTLIFAASFMPIIYRKWLSKTINNETILKAIQVIIPLGLFLFITFAFPVNNDENKYSNSTENKTNNETAEQKVVRIVNSKLSKEQEVERYELNSETNKYDFKIKATDNMYTPFTCALNSQDLARKLIGVDDINSIYVQCISNGQTIYYVKINNIDTLTTDNINSNTKYFNKDNNEVDTNIDILRENIVSDYKKECSAYNYKDVLRNPDEYKGKQAYWFGKIVQVVSKNSNYSVFRIDVTCEKYEYLDGYYCDNTLYVTYAGSDSFIDDDMVKMWGVMNGTETYTTVLGASVTIPKFTAKYMELQ